MPVLVRRRTDTATHEERDRDNGAESKWSVAKMSISGSGPRHARPQGGQNIEIELAFLTHNEASITCIILAAFSIKVTWKKERTCQTLKAKTLFPINSNDKEELLLDFNLVGKAC